MKAQNSPSPLLSLGRISLYSRELNFESRMGKQYICLLFHTNIVFQEILLIEKICFNVKSENFMHKESKKKQKFKSTLN